MSQIMEVLGKVDYTLWNALDDITALREILSDYRDILAAGQENPTVAEKVVWVARDNRTV